MDNLDKMETWGTQDKKKKKKKTKKNTTQYVFDTTIRKQTQIT